jgi:hypothetical protein
VKRKGVGDEKRGKSFSRFSRPIFREVEHQHFFRRKAEKSRPTKEFFKLEKGKSTRNRNSML